MPDRKRATPLDWGDVRFFLAVARGGSLSAAARTLAVNHATVARRVGALEAALGQPVFQRRPDGYRLTERGRHVLERAEAMERSALGLADDPDAATALGPVRLATLRSLAETVLVAGVADLLRRHAGLSLEIVTDTRTVSLSRREADVALRFGPPAASDLVGRRVGRVGYGYYVAPSLARAAADGATPVIGYPEDEVRAVEAVWTARRFADRRFAFRADSLIAQAAAARAGLGVVVLPRYLGARDPGLTEIDLGPPHPARDLWLLCPGELRQVPRVRVLLDAIAKIVAADPHILR